MTATPSLDPVDVSVIVPTYRRSWLLDDLVDSLMRQETSLVYEVLVVDNGNTEESIATLTRLKATHPCRLRVLRIETKAGPARARNAGIEAARGRVVAFTDDDCIATPTWVDRLGHPVLAGACEIAQGRTRPRTDQHDRTGPWSRSQTIPGVTGFYEACNIAYSRALLVELGGFNESFGLPVGEDTDLGLRGVATGAQVAFVDEAVIEHEIWPLGFRGTLKDRTRSHHLPMLLRQQPELRRQLAGGVFWRRGHAIALGIAATTVVATAMRPWLGAAVVPTWIVWRAVRSVDGLPGPGDVLLASQRCAVDAWETATTVAGSVRYRSMLL